MLGNTAVFFPTITSLIAIPTRAGYSRVIVLESAVATIRPANCHLYGFAKPNNRLTPYRVGFAGSCSIMFAHLGKAISVSSAARLTIFYSSYVAGSAITFKVSTLHGLSKSVSYTHMTLPTN